MKTIDIRTQILNILGFGQNDSTFDQYAKEFDITLKQDAIENCICLGTGNNSVQDLLFDDLFIVIIRKCLCDLEIITDWQDLDTEWLNEIGFSWESNGDASCLTFKGKTYTQKEKLYEAVKKSFNIKD